MVGPTYPAARQVAPKLAAYFARHHAEAIERGDTAVAPLAPLADAETIETIIGAAFWSSLRREEGYVPRISIAFLAPEHTSQPLLFSQALTLRPHMLTRVAPAVERAGMHLGVWPGDGGELCVWGTTRTIPAYCFVLEVTAPGLLVIKHHRGECSMKFVNVAVLEGDQVKVVDEQASRLPEGPALLSALLGFDAPTPWDDAVNVLVPLAVSMRAHGRGGSLLVVPTDRTDWHESLVHPIPYAVAPPYLELADLSREVPDDERRRAWQDAFNRAVEGVAGLTAVDGATVLTSRYELLAFGVKIARRRGWEPVDRVAVTEPIEGSREVVVDPGQLGGTRHISAAQFVHDQRDAVALVASQDGRFTVFAWSPAEAMVHAHRIEALLL